MDFRKRLFAVLMSLTMVLTYMPVLAFAETEEVQADLCAAESLTGQVSVSEDIGESDELLEEYFEQAFTEEAASGRPSMLRKAASNTRGSKLPETDAYYYGYLVSAIKAIANGERESAYIEIPITDLLGGKLAYTAEELGVAAIFDESGNMTDDAVKAFQELFDFSANDILHALLFDLPYDFYWFDKTEGIDFGLNCSYYAWGNDEEEYIGFDVEEPCVTFSFNVSVDYRGTNEYAVDTAKTAVPKAAAENAVNIIKSHANETDLKKLYSYKNEICNATSYNDEAMADESTPYGDPWQMIYVFDNDPKTEVVCEGYSKAFQFLCDQTDFDKDIECDSVNGVMDGGTGEGRHMWNILHMDDGKNYVADITNCDEGTIGADDLLFLKGANEFTDFRYYSYDCNGENIAYSYGEETLGLYTQAELTVSTTDYVCDHVWNDVVRKEPNCTERGEIVSTCTVCGETKTTYTDALGHTPASVPGKEPTCTETGLTEGSKCSVCGETITAQTAIAATGHNWGEWTVVTPATEESEGLERRVCKNDEQHFEERAIPVIAPETDPEDDAEEEARRKAAEEAAKIAAGTVHTVSGNTYKVISPSALTVTLTKAKNAKSVTVPNTVAINGKTFKVTQIEASAFKGSKIRTVTIGTNVKTIKANAFKSSKATKLVVKTKLLKKSTVKKSLKSSKIKTVQVKIGSKSVNKKFIKTYKKIFTKSNAGVKVTVK